MRQNIRSSTPLLVVCLLFSNIFAQMPKEPVGEILKSDSYKPLIVQNSPQLQSVLDRAMSEMVDSLRPKGYKAGNIAATLIDLRDANNLGQASFEGARPLYPASVVKLF